MGAVVPWEVSVRDLFSAVRAVLCFMAGGIEAAGLSADSGVLGEMLRSKATTTCLALTHLVPPNRFDFSWRCITNVFLVT